MTRLAPLQVLMISACLAPAAGCYRPEAPRAETAAPAPDPQADKVQAFRDKHEADYRRDWVSIAGLHFLEPGSHTVGSGVKNDIVLTASVPETIGRLVVKGTSIQYIPSAGVNATVKGEPVKRALWLKEEGKPPAPEVVI